MKEAPRHFELENRELEADPYDIFYQFWKNQSDERLVEAAQQLTESDPREFFTEETLRNLHNKNPFSTSRLHW